MSNRNYGGVYFQMSKFTKAKAQMKSNMYYVFWGACTFAVMAGQIYVGNGYRKMSESVGDLTEIIEIKMELELLEKKRNPYGIMPLYVN